MKRNRKTWILAAAVTTGVFITSAPTWARVVPSLETRYENSMETGHLMIKDENGNLLNEVRATGIAMQLDNYALLEGNQDYFYFQNNGTISAFDYETGNCLWTNYDFGGSIAMDCFAVDADNNFYAAGYLGPDLFVMDSNGNTITKTGLETDDSYWPYHMERREDGSLDVTYESSGRILNIVPGSFANVIEREDEGSLVPGTVMKVVKCNEWISLRTGPDTSSERMTEIPLGSDVRFLRSSVDGFYFVEYDGYFGYALAEYLQ